MRSPTLHAALLAYAEEAAALLRGECEAGAELTFDVAPTSARRGAPALYCYRPATGEFIERHAEQLARLPTHLAAARALEELDGLPALLRSRGYRRSPAEPRARALAALELMLEELFDQTTDFELRSERFERFYAVLETMAFEGQRQVELAGVVRGLVISSPQVELGDGFALLQLGALEDGPTELAEAEEGRLIVLWTAQRGGSAPGPVAEARGRLRRLLTPLRLYGDCEVSLEPMSWLRVDGGPWRPLPVEDRPAWPTDATVVGESGEDELRAFCNLVGRRTPQGGELAWALRRFTLGCERPHAGEALSDFLLALRVLLEPEGAQSARLPGRLAALCAVPDERPELAERVLDAMALEAAVISGPAPPQDALRAAAQELRGHLQALLRDVLCGHLDPDLRALADAIIEQEVRDLYELANAAEDPDLEPEPDPEASEQVTLNGDQAPGLGDGRVQVGHDGS